jgi:hypothetical protein
VEGVPHRLQLIPKGLNTVIDDAYNANPEGTQAALETLSLFDCEKVLVTPGMVELGEKQNEENEKFGRQAARVCDYIILVGEQNTRAIKKGVLAESFPRREAVYRRDAERCGDTHVFDRQRQGESDTAGERSSGQLQVDRRSGRTIRGLKALFTEVKQDMKLRIAVVFGGRSTEHEISVISALQAVQSMDTEKYEVIPVYLTKTSEFYVGKGIADIENYSHIPELLKNATRVIWVREGSRVNLYRFPMKKFGDSLVSGVDVVLPDRTRYKRGGRYAAGLFRHAEHSLCRLRRLLVRAGHEQVCDEGCAGTERDPGPALLRLHMERI